MRYIEYSRNEPGLRNRWLASASRRFYAFRQGAHLVPYTDEFVDVVFDAVVTSVLAQQVDHLIESQSGAVHNRSAENV